MVLNESPDGVINEICLAKKKMMSYQDDDGVDRNKINGVRSRSKIIYLSHFINTVEGRKETFNLYDSSISFSTSTIVHGQWFRTYYYLMASLRLRDISYFRKN